MIHLCSVCCCQCVQ